jgi:hypothetical protein
MSVSQAGTYLSYRNVSPIPLSVSLAPSCKSEQQLVVENVSYSVDDIAKLTSQNFDIYI